MKGSASLISYRPDDYRRTSAKRWEVADDWIRASIVHLRNHQWRLLLRSRHNCFIVTGGLGSNIDDSFAQTLFDNCNAVTVSNCTITGGRAGSGVDVAGSRRISVRQCTFEVVEGWGVRIGGRTGAGAGNCHGFEVGLPRPW